MRIELAKLKEDHYKIDYRIKGEVLDGFWIDDDGTKSLSQKKLILMELLIRQQNNSSLIR